MDQVIDLQFLVAHIGEVLEEAGRGATRFILKQDGRDDVCIRRRNRSGFGSSIGSLGPTQP